MEKHALFAFLRLNMVRETRRTIPVEGRLAEDVLLGETFRTRQLNQFLCGFKLPVVAGPDETQRSARGAEPGGTKDRRGSATLWDNYKCNGVSP